jgi:uncharacterized membrane protein
MRVVKEREHMFRVIFESSDIEGCILKSLVLANSAVASVLTLLHAYQLHRREEKHLLSTEKCFSLPGDLLVVGIIANYAAVAADTFSSELGILSKSKPRLITSLSLREVPPGTNGGVTMAGSLAGLLGSLVLVTISMALVPWCDPALSNGWSFKERQRFTYAMTIWGALGSLLDSFLGGWLQQSVVDTRTGRIVEGEGGKTVLVSKRGPSSMHYNVKAEVKSQLLSGQGKDSINVQAVGHNDTNEQNQVESKNDISQEKDRALHFGDNKPSRVVESGSLGLLDNNEVNFLMALTMSLGAMGIGGWIWGTPMSSIFQA